MSRLNHKHELKSTRISIVEFDDVIFTKLGTNRNYYGEGNSKGRVLEFDFEYCIDCGYRLLDGEPIMTRDILEDEFERYVTQAKNGNYVSAEQTVLQHTDFEVLERLIKKAQEFGKLRQQTLNLR